jgi:hypothetical protein
VSQPQPQLQPQLHPDPHPHPHAHPNPSQRAPEPQPAPARGRARGLARTAPWWLSAALAGCAGLPEARMELPADLAALPSHELPVPGGRTGQFDLPPTLGGGRVAFQRQSDRWSFFDTAAFDRSALQMQWDIGTGTSRKSQCSLSRTGLQRAGVDMALQPARLTCEGPGTRLELQARAAAGRSERSGRVDGANPALDIRSVHRIQGAAFTQDEPAGYLLLDGGRPVAAVDLLQSRPLLRVADLPPARRDAVVEAALLLALHWDPAR